jgi:hypothetical protein
MEILLVTFCIVLLLNFSSDSLVTDEFFAVKHDTRLNYYLGDNIVTLKGIDCTGLDTDEQGNVMLGIDVAFQFTSSEGILRLVTGYDNL